MLWRRCLLWVRSYVELNRPDSETLYLTKHCTFNLFTLFMRFGMIVRYIYTF